MSRWLKALLYTVGPVAVLGSVGLTIYYRTGWGAYDLPRVARDLPAAKAEAMKAGFWVDYPAAAKGAMDAEEFGDWATSLRIEKPGSDAFLLSGMTSTSLQARRASLAKDRKGALDLARVKAVAWREVQTGSGRIDDAIKVLAVDAVLAAHLGRTEEALTNLLAARDLGGLLGSYGSIQSILRAQIAEQNTFRGASECVRFWRGNKAALGRVRQIFAKPAWTVDRQHTMKLEEKYERRAVESIREKWVSTKGLWGDDPMPIPDFQVPASIVRDALLARHYRLYTKLHEAAKKGWAEVNAVAKADINEARSLSRVLLPGDYYDGVGLAVQASEARRLVVITAAARLMDPKTPLPEDPLAPGSPLLVKPRGKGFVLYSRGRDGVDGGGAVPKDDYGYEF